MTQVSKRLLRKEIEDRIYEVLMESIASVKSKHSVEQLLDDLLSPTEKLMLGKRMSVALLLMKKYNQREVADTLKVGLETVSRVSRAMQKGTGGYGALAAAIIRNEKLKEFLEKVDDTLANLLPSAHTDWKSWRRARWEAKVKTAKSF